MNLISQKQLILPKPADEGKPEIFMKGAVILVEQLPDPLTLEKLQDSKIFDDIVRVAGEIVRVEAINDAQELLKRLKGTEDLKKMNPDLFDTYEKLKIILKFVSLQALKENDLHELFKNHLVIGLQAGIDVKEKLISFFQFFDDLTGKLPGSLLQDLTRNEGLIGSKPLLIPGTSNAVKPSIKNWLTDYVLYSRQKLGDFPGRKGSLERASYLARNKHIRDLSLEEKEILLRVIELHDWFKYGGLEPNIVAIPKIPQRPEAMVTSEKNSQRPQTPSPMPSAPRPHRAAPLPPRPIAPPPTAMPPQNLPTKTFDKSLDGQASFEKEKYRRALEEMAKQRQTQTNADLNADKRGPATSPGFQPPSPGLERASGDPLSRSTLGPGDFSMNEAIVRGGASQADHGEIVPGGQEDKEVQEKLKKLEDKLGNGKQG